MRERGAYSPLTHTPHPTPHTPHPQHMHTPLRIRPFRRSSPPSRAPPSVFSRTNSVHTHPHSSIHPSVHNTPAGGRDGAFQEKEREERWQDHPFSIAPPRTAPSTFTAHPKPCRAGGEGRGTRIAPPSSPPCLAFVSYCLHTAPSVFTASSRIQPLLRLFPHHTPPQARIQSADPPAEALLQCRCR